jgi:hypothetical protein
MAKTTFVTGDDSQDLHPDCPGGMSSFEQVGRISTSGEEDQ